MRTEMLLIGKGTAVASVKHGRAVSGTHGRRNEVVGDAEALALGKRMHVGGEGAGGGGASDGAGGARRDADAASSTKRLGNMRVRIDVVAIAREAGGRREREDGSTIGRGENHAGGSADFSW